MGYPIMFYVSEENKTNLKSIENRSELINSLLKEYFGSSKEVENVLEKKSSEIIELEKKLQEQKEEVSKIIIEKKNIETIEQEKALEDEKKRKIRFYDVLDNFKDLFDLDLTEQEVNEYMWKFDKGLTKMGEYADFIIKKRNETITNETK